MNLAVGSNPPYLSNWPKSFFEQSAVLKFFLHSHLNHIRIYFKFRPNEYENQSTTLWNLITLLKYDKRMHIYQPTIYLPLLYYRAGSSVPTYIHWILFNLYVMNKYLLHIKKCLNSGIISLWAFFQLSKRLFHLIILSNDTVDYRLIMRADDQGLILLMMKPNHNLLLMTLHQEKKFVGARIRDRLRILSLL